MENKWTAAQLTAIEAEGRDLLVSAGAGSGKTAVLTERIIRRLTDKASPSDITRMLIVTYTKAAAGELRERISSALAKALTADPANRRLSRQLLALERAKICTIHSFCLDLLREGIADSELPTDFRIADDTEITLLRRSIMDDLLEEYYSFGVTEYPIENFGDFADTFVGTKGDEELADIFLGIERELASFTEHIDFVKAFSEKLKTEARDFAATEYGAEILDIVSGRLLSFRGDLEAALVEFSDDKKLFAAYYPAFAGDIEFIDRVIAACEKKVYADIADIFKNTTPIPLGRVKKVLVPPSVEAAKERRKKFREECRKLSEKFFSLTPEQLDKNRLDTACALDKLYNLLSAFCSRFAAEKRRRLLVDFGDLERFAYEILVSNGEPTAVAKAVSERFDEIYIDEYQDVNALQDAIFAAVSRGNNRFMVGDIKQSIYAFRGAEPHIFADYRRRFGSIGDGDSQNGAAIFLSNNFRCDDTVIRFSNAVSRCLFTSGRGDIPFTDEDMLIHSKLDDESGEAVRVVIVDGSEEDGVDAVSVGEAEYVAREIKRLVGSERKNNGELITYSDIAILMRSTKAYSAALEAAFDRHSIPYFSNADGSFFEEPEILLALCILNTVDNPTRDIYLAGALKSPVFGFTLDELISVRKHKTDGALIDALNVYCEDNDFEKGRVFLNTLSRWRKKAEGLSIDKLLRYIFADADLLAIAEMSGSATARANLMLLYEYARNFESSSFKGLYNFIRYLNDILNQKASLKSARVLGEASDTVKLMTIHQSKGLEFPVCFICGTGKKFNENDLRKNIIIERSIGISLKLSDSTGFARYDTPIRQALVKRLADSQLEEEMRVLYVAMTRARERLYVTAQTDDPESLIESAERDASRISRYVIMKNGGYMRWILTALAHSKLTGEDELPVCVETVSAFDEPSESNDAEITGIPQKETEISAELTALIRERFDFAYPSPAASRLPAKLSVSKLTPSILDEDAAQLDITAESYSFEAKRPLFLDSDAAPSALGAERGTATHLFMQFCDFSRFTDTKDGLAELIEDEAARLAKHRFITPRAASLIDIRALAKFFMAETFAEISRSKSVFREHRFNVRLPAKDFTENSVLAAELGDESVLVQGVIDCFFENPDGTLTLIDYKTDHFPPEMTSDDAERILLERHRLQLSYYRAACEKISAKRISRVAIYSFDLGYAIDVE